MMSTPFPAVYKVTPKSRSTVLREETFTPLNGQLNFLHCGASLCQPPKCVGVKLDGFN